MMRSSRDDKLWARTLGNTPAELHEAKKMEQMKVNQTPETNMTNIK